MTLLLPANFQSYRSRLRGVLDGLQSASASDQGQAAAHQILEIEQANGSRFITIDGEPHVFTGFGKRLLPLQHGDQRWAAHMLMVYGLNAKDREVTPKITLALASYTLWNGAKMQPRRWTAYIDGALHLSRYDGTVMRLTGAGVEEDERGFLVDDIWRRRQGLPPDPAAAPLRFDIEDNGANVLFADDDNGSIPANIDIGRHGELFKLLCGVTWSPDTVGKMRPRHQVQALIIWMLASAFPDVFPTKPILMVEGAPGSGKSTLLQMIQQALFGSVDPFTVSEDGERDFWVTLLRSPIMVLDNTDDPIKWLPDAICAYCTRGYKAERRLHTNTGKVEIRPQSFVAVASKDPKSFRREDTADRTIVLRIESRFANGGPGGDSGQAIFQQIEARRARIYGEWLYYLNRVVAALRLEPPRRTSSRLGDFEIFAYAACRALGWQSSVVVPDLMAALARERTAFAAEADIVLDVIGDWMAYPANEGRQVSIRDFFRELSSLADTNNKPFVKTPQALAQRLRAPHVRVMYTIDEVIAGDRRLYTIWAPRQPEDTPPN